MADNDDAATSIDADTLARFVPLSGLAPEYLAELADGTQVVEVRPGHELIGDERSASLTWYLLTGELTLRSGDGEAVLAAGTEDARFAIPGSAQGFVSIAARTPTRLIGVDRPRVSNMLILAQAPGAAVMDETGAHTEAWAIRLLRSALFAHVPPANVQRIFDLMEPVSYQAGETAVVQGTVGEHYFVVRDGTFEVSHRPDEELPPVRLAVLGTGDTFGEEALVSGAERNATVRALTAATVMRMTKEAFVQLIQGPLLDVVDRARADDLVRAGAAWVDVRLPEEHAKNGIVGSLNIPLAEVRARAGELDAETPYVVYCNSGRRSAAGAFLLTQLGLRASVLAGGLHEGQGAGLGADSGIETLGLRAELLEANQALEDALRQKAQVEATRRVEALPPSGVTADAQRVNAERQRQLEQESLRATEALAQARRRKLELEERLREAEARAVSLRSRAQEQIEQLRAHAEERLRAEEARLQKEYAQAAEEMKRIDAARVQAEEHFRAERERLEAELAEARARMEREAERIRAEMESAKRGAQERAAAIQSQQVDAEHRLREETEARLREERRKLESEFATSVEAQEKAKQDLQEAETAIADAQAEAQRLDEQLRSELAAREAAEQARQAAEREELERQRQRAAAELIAAEREKRKAEEKLETTIRNARDEEDTVEQIKTVEAKVAEASEAVESAKAAKVEAEEARERAEARMAAQRELEEELRLQLIEEAETWLLDERQRSESELEQARRDAEHLEELKQRKAESKKRDRVHDESLLADVSAQLGDDTTDAFDIIEKSLQQREYAAEKAALAKRAQEEATAERLRAEQALEEARRKLGAKRD